MQNYWAFELLGVLLGLILVKLFFSLIWACWPTVGGGSQPISDFFCQGLEGGLGDFYVVKHSSCSREHFTAQKAPQKFEKLFFSKYLGNFLPKNVTKIYLLKILYTGLSICDQGKH